MADVVFLWHMHQPYYVDGTIARMPWVRLHAVKGYLDMISLLEDYPGVRVNFNLTPVLVRQIEEIITGHVSDLWFEWSRKPAADLEEEEKLLLLENFFKIHWDNLIKPEPRYWELLQKRGVHWDREDARRMLRYFTDAEWRDLQVWYNLAWCGYTARRIFPELEELRRKGRNFTEEDKLRLLETHMAILRLVMKKYADAEARGQVELTTTPYFHPILPLVYDSAFAERNLPGRPLPRRFHWPQDAAAQLRLAVEAHTKWFGRAPRGLWPSEGSIAPELIPLMAEVGIQYFCSDEENLFRSIASDPWWRGKTVDHLELFQNWRVEYGGASVGAIFREKPLSDFIGFTAAKNAPESAAAHLLQHLRHIAGLLPHNGAMIPLILDGENAWESFPDGGEAFLRALYGGLERENATLQSCTIEDHFARNPPRHALTTLHTGSWISSNFDIWIGEEEENRAWDLLGQTREFLQGKLHLLTDLVAEAALMEIYAAEGSDWFWWYGPDFTTDNDGLFDELFRQHLKNVYALCGEKPPAELDLPINREWVVKRLSEPVAFVQPTINGRIDTYFEWTGAACYEAGSEQGAMYLSDRLLDRWYYGWNSEALVMRLDLVRPEPVALELRFSAPAERVIASGELLPGKALSGSESVAFVDCIEWSIPWALLDLAPGTPFALRIAILQKGIDREIYPEWEPLTLTRPDGEWALRHWIV
jgi:alpha-amylase/alpha-mannosidase (GH57 family)